MVNKDPNIRAEPKKRSYNLLWLGFIKYWLEYLISLHAPETIIYHEKIIQGKKITTTTKQWGLASAIGKCEQQSNLTF